MVTKNWYTVFKAQMAQTTILNGLRDTSGTTYNAGYGTSTSYIYLDTIVPKAGNLNWSRGSTGVVLGSGSTPPTMDDYTLEEMIESGLSGSVTNTAVDENNNVTKTYTITNTSDKDIIIAEIGIHGWAYTQQNKSSIAILIDRTLLEQPITIPAGGVGIVTYTLGMNIPEA